MNETVLMAYFATMKLPLLRVRKGKGHTVDQRARAKDTDDMMFGERAECWYMRAVSGQLCLDREQSVGA